MQRNQIKFYTTGEDYDIFSNVTDIGFTINIAGKDYFPRSSEAVYQGLKAYTQGHRAAAEKDFFNNNKLPGAHLQRAGQQYKNNQLFYTSDNRIDNTFPLYDSSTYKSFSAPKKVDIKEQVMYEILLVKFTQNPAILRALLETQDDEIIENTQANQTYDDPFWGNGQRGNGRNALGIALMRVREDLQNELKHNGHIKVRTGISDGLADSLKIPHSTPKPDQYFTKQQLENSPCTKKVDQFQNAKSSAPISAPLTSKAPVKTQKTSPATSHANFFPNVRPRPDSNEVIQASKQICNDIIVCDDHFQSKQHNPPAFIVRKGNIADTFKIAFKDAAEAAAFKTSLENKGYSKVTYFGDGEKYPMNENGVVNKNGEYKYIVRFEVPVHALKYLSDIGVQNSNELYGHIMGKENTPNPKLKS